MPSPLDESYFPDTVGSAAGGRAPAATSVGRVAGLSATDSPDTLSATLSPQVTTPEPGVLGPVFADLTITAPTSGTFPFMAGHVFKKGDLPAGSYLNGMQATVKSTWDDGSARWAVLAGVKTFVAGEPLVIGVQRSTAAPEGAALTTGDLVATGLSVGVYTTLYGSATWVSEDFATPFETWVSGPVMSSWRYRKQIGTDAHLVAWVEVQLWSDGRVEVLPWVENGYLTVASPGNKADTYRLVVNSQEVFNRLLSPFSNHTRTVLLVGSDTAYWVGGSDPGLTVKHDGAYFMASELIPNYDSTVPAGASQVASLPSVFTPFMQGSFPPGMGAAGYHGSIGLLPQHDVVHFCSVDTRTWKGIQFNAYAAGRYGLIHRDEATNMPLRFSQRGTKNLNTSGHNTGISSAGSGNDYLPTGSGTTPPSWAVSHHPSVGYVAAICTGRAYHLETLQFAACGNFLRVSRSKREDSKGIFKVGGSFDPARLVAWSLRTLAQAAAITPDDSALKSEFVSSWSWNINYYCTTYPYAQDSHPFGYVQDYSDYTPSASGTTQAGTTDTVIRLSSQGVYTDSRYLRNYYIDIGGESRLIVAYDGANRVATVSPAFTVPTEGQSFQLGDKKYMTPRWMHDFLTGAFGYGKAMDLVDDVDHRTKETDFFVWQAQQIVFRFGTDAPEDYLYRDAAGDTASSPIAYSPSNYPNFQTGPWYANGGEVWEASNNHSYSWPPPHYAATKEIGDGSLRGAYFPSASSYWGNLQPAIAYAVRHGVPGATDGYARMTNAPNWGSLRANFNSNPEWGVVPLLDPLAGPWGKGTDTGTLVSGVWTPGRDAQGVVNLASVQQLPIDEWVRVSGSSLYTLQAKIEAAVGKAYALIDVSNGNNIASTFKAWVGCCDDGRKVYFPRGGGHADSSVNGLWEYDLLRMKWDVTNPPSDPDAPGYVWEASYRPTGGSTGSYTQYPFPVPGFPDVPPNDVLPDGKPTSAHTYNGVWYDSMRRTINTNRGSWWAYHIDTGQWVRNRWTWNGVITGLTINTNIHYHEPTDRMFGYWGPSDADQFSFGLCAGGSSAVVSATPPPNWVKHANSACRLDADRVLFFYTRNTTERWAILNMATGAYEAGSGDAVVNAKALTYRSEMMAAAYVPNWGAEGQVIRRGTRDGYDNQWWLFDIATKTNLPYTPQGIAIPSQLSWPGNKYRYLEIGGIGLVFLVEDVSNTALNTGAIYIMRVK